MSGGGSEGSGAKVMPATVCSGVALGREFRLGEAVGVGLGVGVGNSVAVGVGEGVAVGTGVGAGVTTGGGVGGGVGTGVGVGNAEGKIRLAIIQVGMRNWVRSRLPIIEHSPTTTGP